jgi:hypothetical protein
MTAFQQALEDCQLMDLGYCGPKFTWCNGRRGADLNRERLHRAVANQGWSSLFNVVEVSVLVHSRSDHSPLLLVCSNTMDIPWRRVICLNMKQVGLVKRSMGRLSRRFGVLRNRGLIHCKLSTTKLIDAGTLLKDG